ncbi:MAG: NAD-dependent epimerase/dehydratase family protein [Vicinamibacteria bacterium]
MRILLTGGSGFLGGHLWPRLAKDHSVVTGRARASRARLGRRGSRPG